jgi:multidrug efflux pump subunit AcrB
MRLPALAIANYRFTEAVVGLVALLGLLSFLTMRRSEDPVFDIPLLNVVVSFPGADPEVVEILAVDPLEDAIREVESVRTVEVTVEDGIATFTIELLSGTRSDDGFDDVSQRVNEVRPDLPDEVQSVDVLRQSLADVVVAQFALVPEDGDLAAAWPWAEELERRAEQAPGVRRADAWGLPERQVRVSLDADRMRALRVSPDQVAGAIRAAGASIPGGAVLSGDRRLNVRTSGDFSSLEEVGRSLLPGTGGRLLRVDDVAVVEWGAEDESHRARFQGDASVLVTVVPRETANVVAVTNALRPVIEEFESELPVGIRLETVFDQSVSVATRVNGFFASLVQGIALVGLILFLFIGLRPALLVAMSIPIAILFALAGVDISDAVLQQMSIVGLVIALGLLVDDSIVVVENVGRLRRLGMTRRQAAVEGTQEVGWPSVSGTVTTVLAFLPMTVIQSSTGDYIRSLPVTVILALLASLFISLTFTPLMSSRFLTPLEAGMEPPPYKKRNGWLQPHLEALAYGRYSRVLAWSLAHPASVCGIAALSLVIALALVPLVGVSLFPKAEKPQFLVNIEAPGGTSLDATDRVVRWVEARVAERSEVVRYAAHAGHDNQPVNYNVVPRQPRPSIGQVLVELDAYASAATVVPELQRLFDRYPGARVTVTEFENGPPVEAPIVFKVTGPDLTVLENLASRVEDVLRQTSGTRDVRNTLSVHKPDLQVAIDLDRVALFSLDPLAVDRTVRAGLAGVEVGRYRDATNREADIVMRFPFRAEAPTILDLESVTLTNSFGEPVPLAQVATLEFVRGTGRIDHYNDERVATVTAFVEPGYSVLATTREAGGQLDQIAWPDRYRWFAGGTFEEQQEGFAGMLRALLAAMLGIFAVLVLQFKSFLQPLIIFASVPLAFTGAVLALLLTGNTFSFTAFIGVTSLVGIVINNSIILVYYANRHRAGGDSVDEALLKAGQTRFQPIVLTTLTTVGGLIPLALTGSEMWAPLALAIIGGLITSTLLTLAVVPALYRMASGPASQRALP